MRGSTVIGGGGGGGGGAVHTVYICISIEAILESKRVNRQQVFIKTFYSDFCYDNHDLIFPKFCKITNQLP